MTHPFDQAHADLSHLDLSYEDRRSVLLIGDDALARDDARAAIGHADLRLIGTVGFADAVDRLAATAGPDVVAIEAAGLEDDSVADVLETIGTIIRDRDVDVVVAMADDQIDLVAATLAGSHVHLLCNATVADRVAALRWAGATREIRLHDSSRDADDRLRRLNEEVARFAETLSRLGSGRDAPRLGQVRDRSPGFRAAPADEPVGPTDPGEVRDVIRARRMRAAHFAGDLFADPAWDMLLDLFAAELEHRRVSVSSLCIAAAVPGTTALRWIGSMVEAGLFERYADPHDRRRAYISLSATARDGMQRYFHAVRRAGLSPA
ncbi:MAG: winged helix DNA-binding protein [Pseudomonadota bacterium]